MYGFHATLDIPFDAAVDAVTAALKKEGFGVLSDIDIKSAMKEKLGQDIPAYRILGACNPPLAFKALQADPDIGLLLPCNVIVRQEGSKVTVGFVDPHAMMAVADNPQVREVADDANQRLRRACASLSSGDARQ